jgi:hypothetical protein
MGASKLAWGKKPPNKPHFEVGFWGLSLNIIGRRINKKGLYFKAYKMFLEFFGSQYGGGGGD